mmetsp:Transcript_39057/g.99764  ORF Transcript_39057/g.99764 Transcript_39057/m.99764 type:complete len:216 (+) Transcript_39057:236-883(+)
MMAAWPSDPSPALVMLHPASLPARRRLTVVWSSETSPALAMLPPASLPSRRRLMVVWSSERTATVASMPLHSRSALEMSRSSMSPASHHALPLLLWPPGCRPGRGAGSWSCREMTASEGYRRPWTLSGCCAASARPASSPASSHCSSRSRCRGCPRYRKRCPSRPNQTSVSGDWHGALAGARACRRPSLGTSRTCSPAAATSLEYPHPPCRFLGR